MSDADIALDAITPWSSSSGGCCSSALLAAAIVTIIGGVAAAGAARIARPDYTVFHGEPELPHVDRADRRAACWRCAAKRSSSSGLVLLIATPVARVAFTLVAFMLAARSRLRRDHDDRLGLASLRVSIWSEHETPSRGRSDHPLGERRRADDHGRRAGCASSTRTPRSRAAARRSAAIRSSAGRFPPCSRSAVGSAGARNWHFAMMWVLAVNGLVYLGFIYLHGEWRDLVPRRGIVRDAWEMVRFYLTVRKDHPRQGKHNALQRLAYFSMPRRRPRWRSSRASRSGSPCSSRRSRMLLGGYVWARYWHFWAMLLLVVLTIGHVFMVFSGRSVLAPVDDHRQVRRGALARGAQRAPVRPPASAARAWNAEGLRPCLPPSGVHRVMRGHHGGTAGHRPAALSRSPSGGAAGRALSRGVRLVGPAVAQSPCSSSPSARTKRSSARC